MRTCIVALALVLAPGGAGGHGRSEALEFDTLYHATPVFCMKQGEAVTAADIIASKGEGAAAKYVQGKQCFRTNPRQPLTLMYTEKVHEAALGGARRLYVYKAVHFETAWGMLLPLQDIFVITEWPLVKKKEA